MTLAFLIVLIVWWAFLLLAALWGAPMLEDAGRLAMPAVSFIAPCLAIGASCGTVVWIYLDRRSTEPLIVTAVLYVLTAVFSFSFHLWSLLGLLINYMSVTDPRGH
ncbi:MAG: hypothetical protein R3C30_08900 [Hyphomonadaceae bacterium]